MYLIIHPSVQPTFAVKFIILAPSNSVVFRSIGTFGRWFLLLFLGLLRSLAIILGPFLFFQLLTLKLCKKTPEKKPSACKKDSVCFDFSLLFQSFWCQLVWFELLFIRQPRSFISTESSASSVCTYPSSWRLRSALSWEVTMVGC